MRIAALYSKCGEARYVGWGRLENCENRNEQKYEKSEELASLHQQFNLGNSKNL
jgi:hypothetical protein